MRVRLLPFKKAALIRISGRIVKKDEVGAEIRRDAGARRSLSAFMSSVLYRPPADLSTGAANSADMTMNLSEMVSRHGCLKSKSSRKAVLLA